MKKATIGMWRLWKGERLGGRRTRLGDALEDQKEMTVPGKEGLELRSLVMSDGRGTRLLSGALSNTV